ncbi:MAG: DUF5655 domain-containing protein, partial [bacterium]|nr:DUF5655 domain-containing protein [bacterium]
MAIFNITDEKLKLVEEKTISLEKDIQSLTEENMEMVFGLQFISSEFALHDFRIDTLGFDKESSSFVIIEYKRDKNFSVIDQGYAYLSLMLNNKSDFILEYNEKIDKSLRKDDVDWSQSRVLFLAHSFTTYQRNAINFKDLPIELWEVKTFDNSTILYNQLLSADSKESIKTISKNKTIESVSNEVKVYTFDDHFEGVSEKTKELFLAFKEKVLALGDNIEERVKKNYVSYRTKQGFVFAKIQQNKI